MFDFLRKFLGQSNEAEIKKLQKTVAKINALEGDMQKLTDDGIREKLASLRAQAQSGASLDDLLTRLNEYRDALTHRDAESLKALLREGRLCKEAIEPGKSAKEERA